MARLNATEAPDLDAVLVWVTFTVERDYAERGVFPQLRAANAVAQQGASSLHYLTQADVTPILADAQARLPQTCRSLRTSYTAHVRALQRAIDEAASRRSIFEANEAVCLYQHAGYSERWRGTKRQLQAMGIALAGPWPGEEGGKERRAKTRDRKGRDAFITPYSKTWPGLFEVCIDIPERDRKLPVCAEERAKVRAAAVKALRDMPATEDDFRTRLAETMRRWLGLAIEFAASGEHGYSLTDDGIETVLMSGDAVVEAVFLAEVKFDKGLHRQMEQKHRQQIASADDTFQRFMDVIGTASPEILEGSAT